MPANALACRGLRGLTLVACEAGDWPTAPHLLGELGGRSASVAQHRQRASGSTCRLRPEAHPAAAALVCGLGMVGANGRQRRQATKNIAGGHAPQLLP